MSEDAPVRVVFAYELLPSTVSELACGACADFEQSSPFTGAVSLGCDG